MSFLFPVLLFFIFVCCVAFIFGEGMWGAALRFVNVVTAALLATNFWEPVARLLEGMIGASFSYWWDFLSLWMVFAVSLLFLRIITRRLSQVKVRFLNLADRIGGVVFAILVGATMVGFTTFTLHTAPLAEKFMFGGFDPNDPVVGSPDRAWLRFVLNASTGSLSHATDNAFPTDFVGKYAARRAALEEVAKSKKTFRDSAAPKRGTGSGGGSSSEEPSEEGPPEEGEE